MDTSNYNAGWVFLVGTGGAATMRQQMEATKLPAEMAASRLLLYR
jgi:hypothetical protein